MRKQIISVLSFIAAVAIGFYGAKAMHIAYLEVTKQPQQVERVKTLQLVDWSVSR